MKIDRTKLFRYGLCTICMLFYMFWFWVDGIRIESDTNGYVNFSMSREPLYPIFLAIFRGIFGQQYFWWVGVFQSLFWGYAVWYLCDKLFLEMNLDKFSYFVMVGLCFLTSLMTRFVANRRAMYSLDITSEGIAIPLFLLFVTQLYIYVYKRQTGYLITTMVLGVLLISTRKQMYIVVPILAATFLFMWLLKQIKLRKLLMLWGLTIVVFVSSIVLDVGYNLVVRGEAVRHSTDSSALLITTIFTADEEDVKFIEDEMVQQLFRKIIEKRDENGWGYESAPEGWKGISSHYAANFDNIAFGIVNPLFYELLTEQGIEDYVEQELAFGQLNDYMLSSIFHSNIPKILHVFATNAISGFCNTIAKDSSFLLPFVVLVYVLFLLGMLYLGINKKLIPEVWFAMVTVLCIIVNVVAVSAMIFSQSRYMIYNMPIFYCSAYAMFRKIIISGYTKRKEKNGSDCSINSVL